MAGATGRREIDYIGAFNFRVELGGVEAGAFRACSGLKSETEVFEYAEGGENSKVLKLIGGTKVGNITLRKGLVKNDDLWKWRDEIVNAAGEITRKDGSIILCNDDGAEIGRFNFFAAWPVRWEGPELDSMTGQAAVEVLEIAVERLEKK